MQSFLNLFETYSEIHTDQAGDRCFKCINEDQQAYRCHFFPIKKMAQASAHYNLLRQFKNQIGFQQIQYILKCNDGQHGVLVFDWVDGIPLNQVLLEKSAPEKFELGQQAGHLLNQLHQTKIEYQDISMSLKRKQERINDQIMAYLNMGGEFEGLSELLKCYQLHKDKVVMCDLVQCHGDFHSSNLMIDVNNQMTMINFFHQKLWSKDEDISSLIFWDDLDFIKGVLSVISLTKAEQQNTITQVLSCAHLISEALSQNQLDKLEIIIKQCQQVKEKLNSLSLL